jgi:hypothetical protein
MQKVTSLILSFSIIAANTYGMDHQSRNSNIGSIDKLVLTRTISDKGYSPTLQEIHAHDFDKLVFGQPNPYRIVFRCEKNNGSELCTTIFSTIRKIEYGEMKLNIKNEFNRHHTAIDECTRYTGIKDGSKDKQITTSFHNKAVLLQAIEELHLKK